MTSTIELQKRELIDNLINQARDVIQNANTSKSGNILIETDDKDVFQELISILMAFMTTLDYKPKTKSFITENFSVHYNTLHKLCFKKETSVILPSTVDTFLNECETLANIHFGELQRA